METWEVVLILVLVTIAVSVLAKHDIPLSLISTLDNTIVQLVILGSTLAVATVSPAVAIVAMATVVVVYYVRNLAKIQMLPMQEPADDTPRIEVTENTVRTVKVVGEVPISAGTLPQSNTPPPADNKDVVNNALKEHESRPPANQPMIGQRATIGGTPHIPSQLPPEHEDFPNPRGEGFSGEPLDTKAEFYGQAPVSTDGLTTAIDSDVFVQAGGHVDGYNEGLAPTPDIRPFNDNQGQYTIGEVRAHSKPQKYELADFMPGSDMGSNEFAPVGISIDDKIANLQNSYMPSPTPPPNFNNAFPARA
jgi:hypothetical protein